MSLYKSTKSIWFVVLLLALPSNCQNYEASFKCHKSDYPDLNRAFEIELALDKLNLHWIDSLVFIIVGPLAIAFSLVVIFTFFKYKEMKEQPGDLFLMTAISEFLLTVHWMVSAGRFVANPDEPPKSSSLFCFSNAIVAVYSGTLEFLYNISFCLYIYFRLRHILKEKAVPRWIPHIVCLGSSTTMVVVLYLLENFGKSLFGTCSIKAVSSFPFIGPFILLAYIFVAFWTMVYFKKNLPHESKFEKMKKEFFDYYFLYLKSCICIWSIQVLCNLIGVLNCWTLHVDALNFVLTIGNISKLLSPVILSIIRMKDPFLKPKVKRFLRMAKLKKSITQPQQEGPNQNLNEPLLVQLAENFDFEGVQDEEIDYLTELASNMKTSMIYSMLSGIILNDGIEHNKEDDGGLLNKKSKDSSKPRGEEFGPEAFAYSPAIRLNQKTIEATYPNIAKTLNEQGSKTLNLLMRVHAPNIFEEILEQDGEIVNLKTSLDLSENIELVKKASGADGGKSGEFFFFSFDNRVVIKTMTTRELKVLLGMLNQYYYYISTNPKSMIAKIYGLYTFHVENKNSNPIHIIILKNVCGFPTSCKMRVFDLKGSTVSREVFKNQNPGPEELKKKVMKDLDFIRFESKLKIEENQKQELFDALSKDSQFFKKQGIMDYSLIIFKINLAQYEGMKANLNPKLLFIPSKNPLHHLESVEEAGVYYHIGLIDYLQEWTIQKMIEKTTKKVVNANIDLDVSAQDPEKYSDRFIEFLRKIIF